MEEQQEPVQAEAAQQTRSFPRNGWAAASAILLLVLAGFAVSYGHSQRAMIDQLASNEASLNGTIGQMQSQLGIIAARLNEMSATQAAAQTAGPAANGRNAEAATRGAQRVAPTTDTARWRQMQARLEQQQKQLKETQDEVAKTRSDLQGSLSSTRDELNGSIAKTHAELVALENRGERNYYEFDLVKSKQFLRSGPILLSLRKADMKHQHLDLAMIVNDNELTKKNVNLYEPVWVYDTSDPTPLQVVVNQIGKDRVHGYVSVPKYRQANLTGVAPGSPLTPTSNASATADGPVP